MCEMAARYSDRADEFFMVEGENGQMEYRDEALLCFRLFRDAINEAYFDVARRRLLPDVRVRVKAGEDGVIDLTLLSPVPHAVVKALEADGEGEIPFLFQTRFAVRVDKKYAGREIVLQYHYLPDPLLSPWEEPIFPESAVDPMVYVSLAVARVWQSERKTSQYQVWMSEYYQKLRRIRPDMRDRRRRRISRGPVR